jgi:hypothetical protein
MMDNMKTSALAVILTIFLTLVSQAQNQSANLSEWKKISACGVTFNIPSNAQSMKVYPIDSCVKRYQNEDIIIEIDVIFSQLSFRDEKSFRNIDSNEPEFQFKEIQIAGSNSLVVNCYKSTVPKENVGMNYLSKLFVPYIGKDKRGLMIWSYSKSSNGYKISQKIFESISPENSK